MIRDLAAHTPAATMVVAALTMLVLAGLAVAMRREARRDAHAATARRAAADAARLALRRKLQPWT